uniref:Uncharacterized protein n=1 Tax=Octopus bimaculoides TaxID=37653 RepID=A0A0L8HPP4_OCTBM
MKQVSVFENSKVTDQIIFKPRKIMLDSTRVELTEWLQCFKKELCQSQCVNTQNAKCLTRQAKTNQSKITKGGTEEVILMRRGRVAGLFPKHLKKKNLKRIKYSFKKEKKKKKKT